nr:MAG TPA: hypothetical protein [Caudoviricetes sp.]
MCFIGFLLHVVNRYYNSSTVSLLTMVSALYFQYRTT